MTWPTHPHGPTISVTEALGLCQRLGGVLIWRPGLFRSGKYYRHDAAPDRVMAHRALQQVDNEGNAAALGSPRNRRRIDVGATVDN